MMRLLFSIFFVIFFLGCGGHRTFVSLTSQRVPNHEITIDTAYDEELDLVAPGYKIIHVAIKNDSMETFFLNPEKDTWIVLDDEGKRWPASGLLNRTDPEVWQKISPELQEALSYPLAIPGGVSQVIDIFVSQKAPVEQFYGVVFDSSVLKRRFKVLRRPFPSLKK